MMILYDRWLVVFSTPMHTFVRRSAYLTILYLTVLAVWIPMIRCFLTISFFRAIIDVSINNYCFYTIIGSSEPNDLRLIDRFQMFLFLRYLSDRCYPSYIFDLR